MNKKNAVNQKKAQAISKKLENINQKKLEELAKQEEEESKKWEEGKKKVNKKKLDLQQKKEDLSKKKKERDELLESELSSISEKPLNSKNRGSEKISAKRTAKVESFKNSEKSNITYSALGIDESLEVLSLLQDNQSNLKFDRHPEKRVKAAYLEYEKKRLAELLDEKSPLNFSQKITLIRKEFKKSSLNALNSEMNVKYNATNDDINTLKEELRKKKELKFTKF